MRTRNEIRVPFLRGDLRYRNRSSCSRALARVFKSRLLQSFSLSLSLSLSLSRPFVLGIVSPNPRLSDRSVQVTDGREDAVGWSISNNLQRYFERLARELFRDSNRQVHPPSRAKRKLIRIDWIISRYLSKILDDLILPLASREIKLNSWPGKSPTWNAILFSGLDRRKSGS